MFEVNGSVVVRGKVARRAWRQGPWLSEGDILSRDTTGPFVDVVDESSLPLGTALLGSSPERALRLVTSARTRDPVGLLRTRLERADARRRMDLLGADAYRLCHAEADGVVGLYVDRFGDSLVLSADSPEVERLIEPLLAPLVERTGASSVALWPCDGSPARLLHGEERRVRFHHGRLLLTVDLLASRRIFDLTGQLENQRYVRRWARGRVLDIFSGYGGYGLQLADAGATEVTFVEEDEACASALEEDARRNALEDRMQVVRVDPTERLRSLEETGERFDCVVVHPPLLREESGAEEQAARRAFDTHRRVLRLLDEGGMLITWAGSTALSGAAFVAALTDAATRNRKRLQVLARFGSGPDHPRLLGMAEPGAVPTLVARVLDMA